MKYRKFFALLLIISVLTSLFCPEALAASKRKSKTKSKSQPQVTSFSQIAKEYFANPTKAEKKWVGKYIIMEGSIDEVDIDYYNDWSSIRFDYDNHYTEEGLKSYKNWYSVRYLFNFYGIPNDFIYLREGIHVKVRGKINSMSGTSSALVVSIGYSQLIR